MTNTSPQNKKDTQKKKSLKQNQAFILLPGQKSWKEVSLSSVLTKSLQKNRQTQPFLKILQEKKNRRFVSFFQKTKGAIIYLVSSEKKNFEIKLFLPQKRKKSVYFWQRKTLRTLSFSCVELQNATICCSSYFLNFSPISNWLAIVNQSIFFNVYRGCVIH